MKIIAFDPAGIGGDVGWATVDTETKEIRCGAVPQHKIKVDGRKLKHYDMVISEAYNMMFNNGDMRVIKNFNHMLEKKAKGKFKEVQPQARMNVPERIIAKLCKEDKSHHKDAQSALRHALNYTANKDFSFNLWLCNDL